jgi:hypothetical protein
MPRLPAQRSGTTLHGYCGVVGVRWAAADCY